MSENVELTVVPTAGYQTGHVTTQWCGSPCVTLRFRLASGAWTDWLLLPVEVVAELQGGLEKSVSAANTYQSLIN